MDRIDIIFLDIEKRIGNKAKKKYIHKRNVGYEKSHALWLRLSTLYENLKSTTISDCPAH